MVYSEHDKKLKMVLLIGPLAIVPKYFFLCLAYAAES